MVGEQEKIVVFRRCCSGLVTAVSGSLFVIAMQVYVVAAAEAQSTTNITVDSEGTVHASPFEVPLSSYLSPEAKQAFIKDHQKPVSPADDEVYKSGSLLDMRK